MSLQEFNEKILSLNPKLQMYALSLTANQEDANDLLQDTFLKAFTNKDKFNPDTNINAWAYTIMKNTFINNYRRAKKSNTIVDNSKDLYQLNSLQKKHSISPEADYNHGEIMSAIRKLDDDQRIPFEKHVAGYKYKEIADEMNLPIGTVKSRIFLTRQKLSHKLKEFKN